MESVDSLIDGIPVSDVLKTQAIISRHDLATDHARARRYKGKTRMLFGDTKKSKETLLRQLEAYGFSK